MCASGGAINNQYVWHIDGPKCYDWMTDNGSGCTIYAEGSCLDFIEWPKYQYYPQYFTIKVYSPNAGGTQYNTQKKQLVLTDCNHDDPTCEEYYSDSHFLDVKDLKIVTEKTKIKTLIVYDLFGHQLFRGDIDNLISFDYKKNDGILLFIGYDKNGNLIKVDKKLIINK